MIINWKALTQAACYLLFLKFHNIKIVYLKLSSLLLFVRLSKLLCLACFLPFHKSHHHNKEKANAIISVRDLWYFYWGAVTASPTIHRLSCIFSCLHSRKRTNCMRDCIRPVSPSLCKNKNTLSMILTKNFHHSTKPLKSSAQERLRGP